MLSQQTQDFSSSLVACTLLSGICVFMLTVCVCVYWGESEGQGVSAWGVLSLCFYSRGGSSRRARGQKGPAPLFYPEYRKGSWCCFAACLVKGDFAGELHSICLTTEGDREQP